MNSRFSVKQNIIEYFEEGGFKPDEENLDEAADELVAIYDGLGVDVEQNDLGLSWCEDAEDTRQEFIDALNEVCIRYEL